MLIGNSIVYLSLEEILENYFMKIYLQFVRLHHVQVHFIHSLCVGTDTRKLVHASF